MKKKFFALALAAAMVVPATNAFAETSINGDKQTVAGNEINSYNADVTVEGTVRKADGNLPEGKIEVELPLKTSFTVDKDGKFFGSNFTISNNGGSDVNITVASFREDDPNGGITIDKNLTEDNKADKSRAVVKLNLEATSGSSNNSFDLDKTILNENLVDIASGDIATVHLTGLAGTKKDGSVSEVEQNGASENFTLTFKIAKKA